MYSLLIWKDHAVNPANTYEVTENGDGTITLTPGGTVIQQGTNMSAVNFGNMEEGILAANVSAAEALRMIRGLEDKADAQKGIILEATLTNSSKYPFNSSKRTLAFNTEDTRYNMDYTVTVEAEATDGGIVGDIIISDKLVNGFKIEFTGSAESVAVKCYVQGVR